MSMYGSNDPFCECEGTSECGYCITQRQDRDAENRWAERNPIRCICSESAAYHTIACRQQDWSRNQG